MHLTKLFRLMTIFIAIALPASNAFAQDTCGKFERSNFTMRYWHTTASKSEKIAFCQCEIGDLKEIDPTATVDSCVTVLDAMIGESAQDLHPRVALALVLALISGKK